jgi:hypothetical protein
MEGNCSQIETMLRRFAKAQLFSKPWPDNEGKPRSCHKKPVFETVNLSVAVVNASGGISWKSLVDSAEQNEAGIRSWTILPICLRLGSPSRAELLFSRPEPGPWAQFRSPVMM